MITEVNCETGEVIVRDLNEDELKQAEIDAKRTHQEAKLLESKENLKKSVLEKLGLTADEVSALFAE